MSGGTDIPLAVDLDGTLVRGDSLTAAIFAYARMRLWHPLHMGWWFAHGRPRLKQRLAERVKLDWDTLPYNPQLYTFLEHERERGRHLVLATATDRAFAVEIAERCGLFHDVLASDGKTNLKSRAKASWLVDRFGEKGFDYAGNERADYAVWARARKAIVVNAKPHVVREARRRFDVAEVFDCAEAGDSQGCAA